MSETKQKEAEVILFNRGKRKIQYSAGISFPQKKIVVGKEEAKRLIKMFDAELMEIGEGEDPTAKSDRENAIIKILREENAQLKAKIKEIEEAEADAPDTSKEDLEGEDSVSDDEGVDLDGMNRAQLEEFIKDNDLEVRIQSNMKDDTVRNKIVEALK